MRGKKNSVVRRSKKPEGIQKILHNLIGSIEKKDSKKKEKILKVWQKTAGEKAYSHTRPVSIRRKTLIIEIDSSTWLYALNLKKRDLLKEIKKELQEYKIEDIRFRVGDIK